MSQYDKTKIIIVEDEAIIADHLAMCLEDLGYKVVAIVDEAEEALRELKKEKANLVLIDININGAIDGVDLAHRINREYAIPFVFITSNTDKITIERVKPTQPAAFIVKPYTTESLSTNIELALYQHKQKEPKDQEINILNDSFFIKDKHVFLKIKFDELLYAEAFDNYCFLHSTKGKHMLSTTLKLVEEKLINHGFLRIHRSFLVNLRHVDKIEPRSVHVSGNELPLSEQKRNELIALIERL